MYGRVCRPANNVLPGGPVTKDRRIIVRLKTPRVVISRTQIAYTYWLLCIHIAPIDCGPKCKHLHPEQCTLNR